MLYSSCACTVLVSPCETTTVNTDTSGGKGAADRLMIVPLRMFFLRVFPFFSPLEVRITGSDVFAALFS